MNDLPTIILDLPAEVNMHIVHFSFQLSLSGGSLRYDGYSLVKNMVIHFQNAVHIVILYFIIILSSFRN